MFRMFSGLLRQIQVVMIVWCVCALSGCGEDESTAGIANEKDPYSRGVRLGGVDDSDDPYTSPGHPDDGTTLIQPDNSDELEQARRGESSPAARAPASSEQDTAESEERRSAHSSPGFSTGSSMGVPSEDSMDCAGMVEGMHRCADEDQPCMDRCRADSSPEARQQGDAIQNCIDQHGCTDGHCVEEFCRQPLNACGLNEDAQGSQEADHNPNSEHQGAQGAPRGGITCDDVFLCFNQCPPNQRACTDACFAQGSPAAQSQVQAVGDCIVRHQCQEESCVNAMCIAEIEACEGDRPAPVPQAVQGELCGDGEDNDQNGAVDCEDPACAVFAGCRPDLDTAGHCEDPHPIEIGAFEGSTRGEASLHCGECGIPGLCAGEGSEVVFALRVDLPGTYCIDTLGTQYDTVLHARQMDCQARGRQVACNDDHRGVQSQIEVHAQAGVTYYIFMDSYQGGGDFILNTRPGPCP